jgi:chromate transporter
MIAAWIGFTLPSTLLMIAFALGIGAMGDLGHAAWLKGLKLVAVAVVAQAVWGMARTLCPDRPRATLAVASCLIALAEPSAAGQIGAIMMGAVVGFTVLTRGTQPVASTLPRATSTSRRGALWCLGLFIALLVLLPILADACDSTALRMAAAFYQVGALIFGGGHVMLPLLQSAVVAPGWVSTDAFLAGYGAAQAIPGPLSSFAGYLGVIMQPGPSAWAFGLLCVVAIFLPSFLLVAGVLPLWDRLRGRTGMQAALRGVNAAVVGIVLAALFSTMWLGSVMGPAEFGLALAAFLLLASWSVPPWLVVLCGAAAASILGAAGVPF